MLKPLFSLVDFFKAACALIMMNAVQRMFLVYEKYGRGHRKMIKEEQLSVWKIIAVSLCLLMIFGMQPGTGVKAYASENEAISYINADVKNGDDGTVYVSYYETSTNDFNKLTSSSTSWVNGSIYAAVESVDFTDRIVVTGDVCLVLCDGKSVTAEKGIQLTSGSSLTIYGQENGSGKLVATAAKGSNAAGIGGDSLEDGGSITIYGGIVEAHGADGGAGIGGGGGNDSEYGGTGCELVVNGGEVMAYGDKGGAGIGGGYRAAGNELTVNAGKVTAVGGSYGAGIGAGFSSRKYIPGNQDVISMNEVSGGQTIPSGT
ncbi:MAG: hypothetical protein K5989_02175, partial [Lachnospiraceae bacterium]|nr:hypothetical protein [Lachnospiraceae bacterium]